ncbi:MAG: flavodoxin domain-containing protein [Phycisphaerae bacterium]|nr:flavodoxin domain-containing protein [Phycisphaerae bacterium]
MADSFKAIKVTPSVYWVGAIDWDIRNFHGYLTSRGSTYNAFLVVGEKVTLIDTVKAAFKDEMFSRIASVVDPQKIDYIISNHAEMDHSGCLPDTIAAVNPEKVFTSRMGQKALVEHFHMDASSLTPVDEGETVDLGGKKFTFVETKMCHWPDSMVSYLHDEAVLFSQDAFGMHLASHERFIDELDRGVTDYEAMKYYANILTPLGSFIEKTLTKVASLDLKIDVVAPDHGPLLRRGEDIGGVIEKYTKWAKQPPTDKVVVVYDSMWGSSQKMARAIEEGLSDGGAKVKMFPMHDSHRSDVITDLLEAGGFVVGSATMNNGILPSIADVMCYLKGLKPRNLVGGAFGSYGWSGEAPKILNATLEEMGVEIAAAPLRVMYVPDDKQISKSREFGLNIAKKMMAKL